MMKKKLFIFTGILFMIILQAAAQQAAPVTLSVTPVESQELLDYYRFEQIGYFKMKLAGQGISNQYFVLTSNEYWDGKPVKVDTIANTKQFGMPNGTDTLGIRVMSRKTEPDSIKFQFHFPRFATIKKYPTTPNDTYSLRDITSGGRESFSANEPITLMVYSLPYEDPDRPGTLFYCELSREGVPPEKWAEHFGVEHYIIFKLQLVQ